MDKITSFSGNYRWLSNFGEGGVFVYGRRYLSREAAFQSMKCENEEDKDQFMNVSASQAKRIGRKVKLRYDWELVKDHIMYRICKAFFLQHADKLELLLNTGDAILEEGNTWGDTYWGVVDGHGQNKLGKILMQVREELKTIKAENPPDLTIK